MTPTPMTWTQNPPMARTAPAAATTMPAVLNEPLSASGSVPARPSTSVPSGIPPSRAKPSSCTTTSGEFHEAMVSIM